MLPTQENFALQTGNISQKVVSAWLILVSYVKKTRQFVKSGQNLSNQ